MQCYFCRCISQVQLDGNFPRTLLPHPSPRRGIFLENVSYVKTKMFEETWLFDNLLLTYLWVSNRELSVFLLPCWCRGAEELTVQAQALRVGCWEVWDLRPSGLSDMASRNGKVWAPQLQCEMAYSSLLGREPQRPLFKDLSFSSM